MGVSDVIALVLSAGTVIAAFLAYSRKRDAWLRYLTVQTAILFLLQTTREFIYYIQFRATGSAEALIPMLRIFSLAVYTASLYVFPVFILLLYRRLSSLKTKLILLFFPASVLISGMIAAIWMLREVQLVVSLAVNLYFFLFTLVAFIRRSSLVKSRTRKYMFPFLCFTSLYYCLAAALDAYILKQGDPGKSGVLFHGFYNIAAAASLVPVFLYIIFGLRRRKTDPESALKDRYGLNGLELKLIDCIRRGLGNREMCRIFDITPRETDELVYKIYQKLNVQNRRELIEKLENYESNRNSGTH